MKLESLHDLFVHRITDLYDAEEKFEVGLERWHHAAHMPLLQDNVKAYADGTTRRRNRLKKVGDCIDASVDGGTSEVVEAIVKTGDALVQSVAAADIRDAAIIVAFRQVQRYLVAAYETAESLASELACADAAALLARSVRDHEEAAGEVTVQAVRKLHVEAAAQPDASPGN